MKIFTKWMRACVCVSVCMWLRACACSWTHFSIVINGVILVAYIRIKSKKYFYYKGERENFAPGGGIVRSNTWSNRNIFRKLSSILLQLCVCMCHIVRHYSTYFIWKRQQHHHQNFIKWNFWLILITKSFVLIQIWIFQLYTFLFNLIQYFFYRILKRKFPLSLSSADSMNLLIRSFNSVCSFHHFASSDTIFLTLNTSSVLLFSRYYLKCFVIYTPFFSQALQTACRLCGTIHSKFAISTAFCAFDTNKFWQKRQNNEAIQPINSLNSIENPTTIQNEICTVIKKNKNEENKL